jgi:phosphoribosylamine---glycine ligase
MKILILGSGGREHAFAYKLAQSPLCSGIFVAPGNAGTSQIATNLPIDYNDFEAVAFAIIENHIEMVIVGPEEPLVRGVIDYLRGRTDYHISN